MRKYGTYRDFSSLRAVLEKELESHINSCKGKSAAARRYRIEHCHRVAAIGRRVGEKEGLDAELLELGCLLHDIGKWDSPKPVDHGRAGALIVEPLLVKCGVTKREAAEVAQGIAMHTDGHWNPRADRQGTKKDLRRRDYRLFSVKPSVLARSIGDCDNIDRFSTYRIADTLEHFQFMKMSTAQQLEWIDGYLGTLKEMFEYECATAYAQKLWHENLRYQRKFFKRLRDEIRAGLAVS